jgi:tRNA pseudouridine65 synthase
VSLPVVAQGQDWAVVAKPPGVIVHRNAGFPTTDAVALQIVRRQFKRRVYPIHRLDRSASGCLLFGLAQPAAGPLQAALSDPSTTKEYIAFVRGDFRQEGWVPVDTNMRDDNGVDKEAHSQVMCLGHSSEPRCSLLLVRPFTGRYHQVRRHVRDLNHPILGDTKHGDSKCNRMWRETWGLPRLGLHCLTLNLPTAGITATCPLFEDMAAVLTRMPWWDEAVAQVPALGLPPLSVRIS